MAWIRSRVASLSSHASRAAGVSSSWEAWVELPTLLRALLLVGILSPSTLARSKRVVRMLGSGRYPARPGNMCRKG
jgi:hypothetical protein